MIYQTRAIVLRTVRFGETSLIADMYTEQKGHQTFMINSVRKAKAITPASYLQVLNLVELVAYYHDNRKINRIREVRLEFPFQSISFDRRKSSVIMCLAEIMAHCLTTAYPQPDLFRFIHDELIRYDEIDSFDRDFLIRFLVSMTHHLGFGFELPAADPDGKYFDLMEGHLVDHRPLHDYVMDADDVIALKQLLEAHRSHPADIPLSTRRRLIDLIILYYQLHVESLRTVHSLKILRELF